MNDFIEISEQIKIPLSILQFKFSRSGGKGGQNVNKVETKVELSVQLNELANYFGSERDVILENLSSKADSNGIIKIVSQRERSQWKNKQNIIQKLQMLLQKSRIRKIERVETVPSASSKQKRISAKKKRSEIKSNRRFFAEIDE